MAYLIGIVSIALRYGRGPSLLATLLAALVINFFFVPPYYSLKMTEDEHLITFLVLLITGVIIGTQTARLRMQAISARRREKNTSSLFAMSRELTANRGKVTLAQIAAQHIAEILESDVFLWLPDAKGQLQTVVAETEAETRSIDPVREESVANWTFAHRQNAGLGTDTLPSAKALYVPQMGSSGVVGVIGIMPHDPHIVAYATDTVELLEALASITASALERAQAAELVEKTIVEAESEKLRNILLSSVSHDLRTPLAAITGAASTLLLEGSKITEEYKKELLRSIHEEGARLARMVTNLLDVSSLESGSVKLNKELYFIEELIGSALMRVESKLARHKVATHIEHGLPLLRMDGLLIEQVLINLLENAAEFTPTGTTVTIAAITVKPDIHVIVSDNGPGIAKGEEERIFDKFYGGAEKGRTRKAAAWALPSAAALSMRMAAKSGRKTPPKAARCSPSPSPSAAKTATSGRALLVTPHLLRGLPLWMEMPQQVRRILAILLLQAAQVGALAVDDDVVEIVGVIGLGGIFGGQFLYENAVHGGGDGRMGVGTIAIVQFIGIVGAAAKARIDFTEIGRIAAARMKPCPLGPKLIST